jgi:hypothetical protein
MPGSPFTNPTIRARVESNVLKVQSALLEWSESPTTDVDYHTKIVQTLVDTLDAHASAYLEGVEEESQVQEYKKLLRVIGRNLIENAEKRSVLSDLYSDQRLRKIVESSGDLNLRIRSLTPEQRESVISEEIKRLRSQMAPLLGRLSNQHCTEFCPLSDQKRLICFVAAEQEVADRRKHREDAVASESRDRLRAAGALSNSARV